MEDIYEKLSGCALFAGTVHEDIRSVLSCLGAAERVYEKDEAVLSEGEPARYIGIVLEGNVCIMRTDIFGNRSILAKAGPMDMFGEALACAEVQYMPVDVVALEKTRLVLIDAERVSRTCGNDCGFHSRIINNLLHVIASKNLMMNQKLEVTSKRSTREKLMAYLMLQAKQKGSSAFTIPFDRQELADYLEVDRSGLSAEIGKLRREGLIECSRSDFTIIGIRDP